ncbi:MAG TPA: radical SAM protein [Hadesarchaea archaeon]|nr:radical SAM protein [Hadesarchaea archaeon]
MEIVYGPVSSWRLGRSLGVDLICQKGKVCPFDCTYCSLGRTTELTTERRVFVPTERVARDLGEAMKKVEADVVTFSGTGEPTLSLNLGEAIKVAKEISGLPVAVLTNSSLMNREDVRRDLAQADVVVGELDAPNEEIFKRINRPYEEIRLADMIEGMKKFRAGFNGKFSLEVMCAPENKDFSKEIAAIARTIRPDEVQINAPLRSSPVRPLTPEELNAIKKDFKGMNARSVYETKKVEVKKVVGPRKLRQLKRPKARKAGR